ncbi:MAG: hypothetical protein RL308_2060 [Bacteroidota bacterium]|jgi:hypothetical protein
MKTNDLLFSEDDYWMLIQNSIECSEKNKEKQAVAIHSSLTILALDSIIIFNVLTKILYNDLDTKSLRKVCSLINNSCSEEEFSQFRFWIISKGERAYNSAVKHPETLLNELNDGLEEFKFENIFHLTSDVYEFLTD